MTQNLLDISLRPVQNLLGHTVKPHLPQCFSKIFFFKSGYINGGYLPFDDDRRRRRYHQLDPLDGRRSNLRRNNRSFFGGRRSNADSLMYDDSGEHELAMGNRMSFVADWDDLENGDSVVLVRERRPRTAPFKFSVLRGPKRGGLGDSVSADGVRPGYGRQNSKSRVFQIVKDGYERRVNIFSPLFFSGEILHILRFFCKL